MELMVIFSMILIVLYSLQKYENIFATMQNILSIIGIFYNEDISTYSLIPVKSKCYSQIKVKGNFYF